MRIKKKKKWKRGITKQKGKGGKIPTYMNPRNGKACMPEHLH
jgi:hypothetical protein